MSRYFALSPVTIRRTLFLLLLGLSPAHAAEPLALQQAAEEALASNPGLAATTARAEALAAIPEQRGTLPDPHLSLNLLNVPLDSFSLTQEGMTQLQIGISQALPYPGKLALQEAVARELAEAASQEVEELRLALVRDVKVIWWNLFYLDRALEIVETNQALLRQFVEVAQSKYQVGKGLQQDVLLAQLELSRLLDRRLLLEGVRRNEAIRLNTLLDRPVTTPVVLPAEVDERAPRPLAAERLLAKAMERRPRLAAKERLLEAARLRVELAEKDYYPDFRLGAAWGVRGGENPDGSDRSDFGSLQFSMNLPIYSGSRQDKALDQRNSERLREQFALQELQRQVAAEIGRALSDYRRSAEQAVLFKSGIIPQASQTVASMLAGYQVNKVDFLNLVRSQITLYNYETHYWKVLSESRQALARLAAAVGEEAIYEK